MRSRSGVLMAIMCTLAFAAQVRGQGGESKSPASDIKFQQGPMVGKLGNVAEVHVPGGYVFADGDQTRKFMEVLQNPTSGTEVGLVASSTEDWYVVFEFDGVGYVKDDEKSSLDAGAMLKSIQKATELGNAERKKRGWPAMTVVGWETPPRYNATTHNLEWAIRGESEGSPIINHNTRLLGRGGVMRVTLVVDPKDLAATMPKFKSLIDGYTFSAGNKYAEYRQGDKIAKYGLTALVVGGAGAVAVKTGLFKWLWKLLVVAGVGISAFFKKLFGRKS